MKRITFIILILLTFKAEAQVQVPPLPPIVTEPGKRKTQSANSEIDKLYEKYKDSKTVTLFTPYGNFIGDINIEYNDENKPVSVKISGRSENPNAVANFLVTTNKMKIKQGYKSPSGLIQLVNEDNIWSQGHWSMTDEDGFEFTENSFELLMKKSTMYFRINAVMHTKTEMNASQSKIAWCNWYIETGDTKRQGGANATIFEF